MIRPLRKRLPDEAVALMDAQRAAVSANGSLVRSNRSHATHVSSKCTHDVWVTFGIPSARVVAGSVVCHLMCRTIANVLVGPANMQVMSVGRARLELATEGL